MSEFTKQLIKQIKEKKPNISSSSISNYIRNLELLNDGKDLDNLDFLEDTKEIMKKLDSKKPNTRRNYLIAIVSMLHVYYDDVENKTYKYYLEKMIKSNNELKEIEKSNVKSETQEKNWMEWDEIKKILNDLENKVKTYDPLTIDKKQYKEVLKMIVLSLYVLNAPRRNQDYQDMYFIGGDYVPISKFNYLIYGLKEFVFRKYKTAKTEQKKNGSDLVISINETLMKNIELYMKFHPSLKKIDKINYDTVCYFLVNFDGSKFEHPNSITTILNNIFESYDKRIGSSMLRHIFLSSQYGENIEALKQMQETAKNMSHSSDMQLDYIKK